MNAEIIFFNDNCVTTLLPLLFGRVAQKFKKNLINALKFDLFKYGQYFICFQVLECYRLMVTIIHSENIPAGCV